MFKSIIIAVISMGFSFQVSAQAKFIEKVTQKPGEVVIPYEKYVLPNGLTVLIHEDHSDPICHVDVTYHVGSAREEIGKSGFAHFFEHMMFQGSDHVADEQHFKIITESGGTLNGSTNKDRTNYFETVPSNQLEKMLWLESDRMGFLLDAVTQKKFEVQRATVKNERGQNYDNRPYGLVQETLSKALYPYGHPYSWLTIGYIEDLNSVNVQDLKNFFLRWYGPNNAVLTVGGDVDVKTTLALIEKYFGSIPQCPKVEKTILPMTKLDANRYISMTDAYAKIPMLVCAIPTVPAYSEDEAALDCLADILGGDNSSILYQNLVKAQRALSVRASHPTDELAGSFQFNIMPKPGTNLREMEKEIQIAFEDFEKRGITDDDIAKFKASREASTIYNLESVSGKVSRLASFQTFTGNANYIKDEMRRYNNIRKEDVMRVYNQYIKDQPLVVLSVLTKGNEFVAAEGNNYRAPLNDPNYKAPNYGYNSLKYVKAKENFDRNVVPNAGPNPSIKVPKFKKIEVDGMTAISATSTEIPVVVMSLGLKGGRLIEQQDLNKVGLANIFAAMMEEDTRAHTSEEMSILLDKLGSSISFNADVDEISMTVRSLKKNLKPTMELVMERLTIPKFTEDAFSRIKNQYIESIKNSKTRAANVANVAYSKVNYGSDNILGYPSIGTEASLANITLSDIENYFDKYFNREGLEMVLVGDITDAEALAILGDMKKLRVNNFILPSLPVSKTKNNPKEIFVVNIPKAAQTEFRVGYVTNLKYDATGEYYKSGLMNFPLGGAFNSRINLNLREDKGWTYGARSYFSGNNYTGTYTFSSGIKSPVTDSALAVVMDEIQNFVKKGITKDELIFMKSAIGQSDARKYETLFQKAGFLSNILAYDLPINFVDQQNKILNTITAEDINKLAKKWLNKDNLQIVLAGDKEAMTPGLEKLGYKIVELDGDGNVVN